MTTAFASPFAPLNPFLSNDDTTLVDVAVDVADPRDVSYALVKSGPAVSPEEVESHLDAVEVKVSWGSQILSCTHLEAGKSFSIGELGDFVVPGLDEAKLTIVEAGTVVVPANAHAVVSAKGETSREVKGGDVITLADGMTVHLHLDPVTIEIAQVRAGKKTPVGFLAALASGAVACIGLSFVGHAAIVASLAMFMPKMAADDAESISREQILSMQTLLNASAEREADEVKSQDKTAQEEAGGGAKGGEPHKGDMGAAGTTRPVTTSGHMAFRGSDDKVRLSRRDEIAMAQDWGLIGILNSGAPPKGHASPWATDTQLGQDPDNKLGSMFGSDANDAMGYGLGLSGPGEGGGGNGLGIGIDGIGSTVGGGGGGPGKWGFGKGIGDGWGNGHGPGKGGHVAKAPSIRQPITFDTNGRLPPEVIQRIVRQNFGRFRLCYESGLRQNPGLTGRVVTKFVIGRDGAVAQATDGGSDIASQEVIGCVVRSFATLSFPQPEGGVAVVTYPIVLSPGDG